MKTLAQDTSPAAERVLIQLWREMPGWRRMELMGEMYTTVKTLACVGLAQRFPNATSDEIERRLKDVLLGTKLAARVYGKPTYEEPNPSTTQDNQLDRACLERMAQQLSVRDLLACAFQDAGD